MRCKSNGKLKWGTIWTHALLRQQKRFHNIVSSINNWIKTIVRISSYQGRNFFIYSRWWTTYWQLPRFIFAELSPIRPTLSIFPQFQWLMKSAKEFPHFSIDPNNETQKPIKKATRGKLRFPHPSKFRRVVSRIPLMRKSHEFNARFPWSRFYSALHVCPYVR